MNKFYSAWYILMTIPFITMQKKTNKYMKARWYGPKTDILNDIQSKVKKISITANEYSQTSSSWKLNELRGVFGDLLFSVCCLANSYGEISHKRYPWKINLQEILIATPIDSNNTVREDSMYGAMTDLKNSIQRETNDLKIIQEKLWVLLLQILRLSTDCTINCEHERIDLSHAFILNMRKLQSLK